jgi:DNA polymerase-3 subunit epsilon
LEIPSARYYCTYQIARLVWQESPKFSLDYLCNEMGFEFSHHKADSDAEACARLLLYEAEQLGVETFEQLKRKLKIRSPKL